MKLLTLGLLLSACTVFSQQKPLHQILPFDTSSKEVPSEIARYKKALQAKYKDKFSNAVDFNEFVYVHAASKEAQFKGSYCYHNWLEAEQYLTSLMKLLITNNNVWDSKVKVERTTEVNACAYEDGSVFVTLGLLANASSEAQLAAVLGHECGHKINSDAYRIYMAERRGQDKAAATGGTIGTNIFTLGAAAGIAKASREMEEQADTCSFHFISKSNFSHKACALTYKYFEQEEEKMKLCYDFGGMPLFSKMLASHPMNKARIKAAEKYFSTRESNGGTDFPYNKDQFYKIKRQASDELIFHLYHEMNYNSALETAYKMHLMYPNDEFYIFYLIECTKKIIASQQKAGDELFIAGNYKTEKLKTKEKLSPIFVYSKKGIKDSRINESVFALYQSVILNYDSLEWEKMRASPLVKNDTLEFLTYNDALDYFSSLARKINCSVCFYDSVPTVKTSNNYGFDYSGVKQKKNGANQLFHVFNTRFEGPDYYGRNKRIPFDTAQTMAWIIKEFVFQNNPKVLSYNKLSFENAEPIILYDFFAYLSYHYNYTKNTEQGGLLPVMQKTETFSCNFDDMKEAKTILLKNGLSKITLFNIDAVYNPPAAIYASMFNDMMFYTIYNITTADLEKNTVTRTFSMVIGKKPLEDIVVLINKQLK
ncbi:MAG: M48 family metalloprotease [Bacteroidia bacterium]